MPSFIRLLWFTKKYRWLQAPIKGEEAAVRYSLRLNGAKRDVYLRTNSGDLAIFYEIFWKKVYGKVQNTGTIIDAGANTGLSALFFLQDASVSKIICIEPDPSNIQILKKNLAGEIAAQKIFIAEVALGDKDGIMYLESAVRKYNSKVVITAAGTNATQIKVRSMDDLLNEYSIRNVDLLKMDIEGSEVAVFSGGLNWLKVVQEIIVETHSIAAEELSDRVLQDKGFKLYHQNCSVFHWLRSKEKG